MIPSGLPLAAQIGFLVAGLSKDNYNSVSYELSQLTNYGPEGCIILLRECLEQVNLAENDQNLQLKLDLLALVIRRFIYQPNLGTILCEALRRLPFVSEDFLSNLCKALKLSLPEQIALGIALTDAEDLSQRQQGQVFCETKIKELSQNPVPDLSEYLIAEILWFLYSNETLSKLAALFLKSLPSVQPCVGNSLLLTSLLKGGVTEVDCLRDFDSVAASGTSLKVDMVTEMERATDVVSLLEELGFGCTFNVDHCKEILSLGGPLKEDDVARILGTVAHTAKGLEESQSIHGAFYNTLCSGELGNPMKLTSWNVDVILDAIKQLHPSLNWSLVIANLDYEGFSVPDENSFSALVTMYRLVCEDPFPLEAVCGRVWKNEEGQLAFLRHAVSARPEIFTFAHSTRKLTETQEGRLKSPNHAWLSLDLLETLCHLAELGRIDQVRDILEYPRIHCRELLALGLVQTKVYVPLKETQNKFQADMLSLILPPYFDQEYHKEITGLFVSKLWSLNPEAVTEQMVKYMVIKDARVYDHILRICCDLSILLAVLDRMPFEIGLELAALASRREYLDLEKWLEEKILVYRDSFVQACLKFLQEKTLPDGEGSEQNRLHINHLPETYAIFLRVLHGNSGQLASQDLVDEVTRVNTAVHADTELLSVPDLMPQESNEGDVDKEANLYFEKVYSREVPIETVVNMLKQFDKAPANLREKAIFLRMLQCLFEELPLLHQYPDKELDVTAVLFGSLINQDLIVNSNLNTALKYIMDALRKPVDSKMFSFALRALDEFRDRLKEWPQICLLILQVPHIQEAQSELVEFIVDVVNSNHTADASANFTESNDPPVVVLPMTVNPPLSLPQDTQEDLFSSGFGAVDTGGKRFSSTDRYLPGVDGLLQTLSAGQFSSMPGHSQPQSNLLSLSQSLSDSLVGTNSQSLVQSLSRPASAAPTASHFQLSQYTPSEERPKSAGSLAASGRTGSLLAPNAASLQLQSQRDNDKIGSTQYLSTDTTTLATAAQVAPFYPYSSAANGQASITATQTFNRTTTRSVGAPGSLRTAISGFGHALNIETLVAAAGKRDTPIEAPSSEVQDKVAFIINNISTTNLESKAKECLEVLKEEYYPWFAQYMVMKRASIEPNFHDVYIKFLDKINSKALHKDVVKTTYENCKVLLRSELIKTHSEERSLLKNLGSWLGKLTIRRNQALRAREIDPKSLIIEAYEKGLMIAIIPFTSKILEPCQQSLAYQPPNPWTMGILGLLAEIYNLPNLKMNLKFDIEVLFKNLNVDMKEVKQSKLLEVRERQIEGNPDFSNRDNTPPPPGPSPHVVIETATTVSVTVPLLPPQLDLPPELPVVTQSTTTLTSSQLIEEGRLPPLSMAERVSGGQVPSHAIPSQQPFGPSQVSMTIPDLSSYVVLNSKLAGLGQQLQLNRVVPMAMERAIREIISPVVDRSVTIACMTTRELVIKDYAMEADESRTNQSANLMVASLAGSLAHVTCKEPLRVAMANYLRSYMQSAISVQEVLEQAVNLVTNDNLDLGCAVIEKAATEKRLIQNFEDLHHPLGTVLQSYVNAVPVDVQNALRDLDDAIGPVMSTRRASRERMGSALYDKVIYSSSNLAPLPEALRPKPGKLSNAQQRVYEDFARLPWQNQPSHTPVTAAGAPGIPNLPGRVMYSIAGRDGSGTAFSSVGGNQSMLALGGIPQVSDLSSDELDIREQSPLSFTSTTSAGGADGQARLSQENSHALATFPGGSTPPLEATVAEVTNTLKVMIGGTQAMTPPSPAEQLGSTVDPSLTTGEALDTYNLVAQKLDLAISRVSSFTSSLPPDHEVRVLVNEVPEIITQCVSRDEAALAIAQKVFKRLYENTASQIHVVVHLGILEAIRDVCKRVVKELTSWVVYSDEERKFNREITVGLIRSELINLSDYNLHLTKWIDGGRNQDAVDFAAYLVKTCVIEEAGVSNTEFYNVIEALGKLAARPGSPESLQQLVEIAKNTTSSSGQAGLGISKDDKGRLLKDKKLSSSRTAGLREDGKLSLRESAAGDPQGLRDQVTRFFEEWARICDAPGTNDKAYAMYMSQLQSTGMLKGDDISDRFFRILIELAETHCLNSETPLPSSGLGEPRQQGVNLSFAAIDMFAKLVVLLVKYPADPSMSKVNLLNKVLNVTVRVIKRDHERKSGFHPRPYFRLFVTWLMDFNSPDSTLDSSNFQVLTAFGYALLALQPLDVPGWSFAWLELISHRTFMPKLLLSNSQKGWPLFQRLLVALFKFMEPYLRKAELSEPVRLLYKGTLRVLLVLLHDFPEFLCDHHFSFCDVIPPSCIQMRNLILSAFPRNMRLPDPFTPNLKVDLLPEIAQAPRILSDVEAALKNRQLKADIDEYIKTRQTITLLSMDLKGRLTLSPQEAVVSGTRYNVPLLNALVLYVGMQAVQQLHSKSTPQQLAVPTAPITHSAPMDIFQRLVMDLDTEGRYLFLNAVANQLRYPNNHTHYFSCVLLFLFAEAQLEIIQEQITRVLLERLIVNRPHPWGLLITFIELIKNPRYSFWTHSFTRCAPEIDKLFESVARSCMTPPPLKQTEDELSGSITADGVKG